MTENLQTDVVIIGAGPAGLFAIFECGMLKMQTIVIDPLPSPGGQCVALYPEKPIYDIAGYPKVGAAELIEALKEQAAPFSPHYIFNEQVISLLKQPNGSFQLGTSKGKTITAKAVIIAAGCGAFGPNRPPLAGIEAFEAAGSVVYMVSKMEQYRGKTLVIAGGGDSAVDWTINLAPLAKKIYVIHRRDKFRASPETVSQMKALASSGNVEMVVPYQLHALQGDNGVLKHVEVQDLNGNTRLLEADALLAFFGLSMELGPIADWGLQLDKKHISVNPATMQTNIEGVYAVGDIAHYPGKLKLIVCGFSEAAMAAHAMYSQVHPGEVLHFEYSTTKGVP